MLIGAAVNLAAQSVLSNDTSSQGPSPFETLRNQQSQANSVKTSSQTQQTQPNSSSNEVPAWMQTLQQGQGQGV